MVPYLDVMETIKNENFFKDILKFNTKLYINRTNDYN